MDISKRPLKLDPTTVKVERGETFRGEVVLVSLPVEFVNWMVSESGLNSVMTA